MNTILLGNLIKIRWIAITGQLFAIIFVTYFFNIEIPFFEALIIILFSQLFDITYYDGKISLIFVILLAGAKCIIEENSKLTNNYS